jgi:RNA polymerase sigma-70 factor, ECF subfamily
MLLRAARSELRRRRHPVRLDGRELEDPAHQAADDALVAIISKLDGFRGESRFTTWAYKFVIFEVSAKLGRHYWRQPAIQVHNDASERIPDRLGADPAQQAESRELAAALREAVTEVLSDRQRHVFAPNAIYKTMFDARGKIRAYLVAHGYLHDQESRKS